MKVGEHYLSPEGFATVRSAAAKFGRDLAARRALRETALALEASQRQHAAALMVDDRRTGERRSVDRRGAITVEIDGQVVIRPRKDLVRFDERPADVSAFGVFDELTR